MYIILFFNRNTRELSKILVMVVNQMPESGTLTKKNVIQNIMSTEFINLSCDEVSCIMIILVITARLKANNQNNVVTGIYV